MEDCTYKIIALDKEVAREYSKELYDLVNLIPLVTYTEEDVLAESKEDRAFHYKWDLSHLAMCEKTPVGVIMGYEREADGAQYSKNSIYISELAVTPTHQGKGIATELVKHFIERAKKRGLKAFKGPLVFTVQTNSASWNKVAQGIYKSFGFSPVGIKQYPNRTDWIMEYQPDKM